MFFCPDCHVSNRADAKFCRKCGKSRSDLERVKSSVAAAQTAVVEPAAQSADVQSAPVHSADVVSDPAPVAIPSVDGETSDTTDGATVPLHHSEQQAPQCPSCWETLRATDKFCCWCGEAQPNRVLPFMKLCLECSTFLPEKANYCYSCGTDVGYSSRRKIRLPVELFKDEDSEFFPTFDA